MNNYKKINHTRAWEAGILNVTSYYESLLSTSEINISDWGTLVAPPKFKAKKIVRGRDNNHFAMHPHYLEVGYKGIAEEATRNAEKLGKGENRTVLESVARVYMASAAYVGRYATAARKQLESAESDEEKLRLSIIAKTCENLSNSAPSSFFEACQLFLFSWRIRSHEKMATIGRLDQYLYPFYKKDIENGTLTDAEALDILVEVWRRIAEYGSGDTLTNIMLGGVDRDGNDATNELSCLMLEASLITKSTEPQMNCRIHKETPKRFFDLMIKLKLLGHGQATMISDDAIIPHLVKAGFPLESARNYANDGCNEIIIDCESTIDFTQIESMKSLELTIFEGKENVEEPIAVGQYWTRHAKARPFTTGAFLGYAPCKLSEMDTYDKFYEAYLDQYKFQLYSKLDDYTYKITRNNETQVPSPFLLGSFPCVLEKGEDIHSSPDMHNIHSVFLGSLTTVADCLAALKKVVFEDKYCTLETLRDALAANFEGYAELRAKLKAVPKYGNDDDYVDSVAVKLTNDVYDLLDEYNDSSDYYFIPCIYNYLFVDHARILGASPDGRCFGDAIAPHASPTPGCAVNGPTAVIKSTSKIDTARGCGASPLYLSLSRETLVGNDGGELILSALMRSCLELGIQYVNVAIHDTEALLDAQKNPELHEDLIVRVWGYSARFVDLCTDMQNHVIQRTIK